MATFGICHDVVQPMTMLAIFLTTFLLAGPLPAAHGFHQGSIFGMRSAVLPIPCPRKSDRPRSLIHNTNDFVKHQHQQMVLPLQNANSSSCDDVEDECESQNKKITFLQELWPLLLLSLLSGIPSSCRQIAESHISRMPDCPIAHDIDTLLLWPAIPMSSSTVLPPTIFQTPAAAVTQVDKYTVNWDLVTNTYLETVLYSLGVSVLIALGLWWLTASDENEVPFEGGNNLK